MIQRVAATIARFALLRPGMMVGAAVSGGADSVCLLYVLRELGYPLRVLHLNHHLRGAESDADAEFVRELAARLGLPCDMRDADPAAAGGNLEQAGREARLACFRQAIASGAVDRVALGHTRSDQAETVLFRLLRGAGSAGLAGIRPATADGIVRPLLEIDRADVERYLRDRGIAWREDSTNAATDFARNRIRHQLLPQLQREWNPAIHGILAHTAEWAQAEEAFWNAELERLSPGVLVEKDGRVLLRAAGLNALPLAIARRLVRRAIHRAKGDLRRSGFEHVEAVLRLAASPRGHGRLQLPGLEVLRSFDWVRFGKLNSAVPYRLAVSVPGVVRIPGSGAEIHLELIEKAEIFASAGNVYNSGMGCLDWGSLCGSLELRNWQPGDRYQPAGSSETKLKTLFQKSRIPLWERRQWPVLVDGGAVVWTRRFGPAARVAAGPEAVRVLRIRETEID